MANVDNEHGFRAIGTFGNKNPGVTRYRCWTTTPVYIGDVVQMQTSGKVKAVTSVAGSNATIGVAATYGGTAAITGVTVWDDPDTIFEGQTALGSNPGASTALAQIGATANLVLTTGDTTTKLSKQEISSTFGTTTNAPIKILGFYGAVDNDQTLAHARIKIKLQRHINAGRYAI